MIRAHFIAGLLIYPLLTLPLASASEFEKLLEKNKSYKTLIDKVKDNSPTVQSKEEMAKINQAIDAYLDEKNNPKIPSKTELVRQAELDMKSCPTCQSYMNLSANVNEILAKLDKGKNVADANKLSLELNHLNFLYYVVKFDNPIGGISCNKYGNISRIQESKFPGSFNLMAEEVFDLPNVNEVQYIPEGGKEVVYLYRGVGSDNNRVFEVHLLPEGKAFIREYEYTPSSAERESELASNNLRTLLTKIKKPAEEPSKPDNYIDIGVKLHTRDTVIPTDLEVVKAQTKTEIAPDLVLGTKTLMSFNEQSTEVSVSNKEGEAWLQVNAKNKTEGKHELVTIIPLTINVDKESKLNLSGSLKTELGVTRETGLMESAKTINMGLTDHNHKYIEVEVYQRTNDNYSKVSLNNNLKLGEKDSINLTYSQDNLGVKSYTIGKDTSLGNFGHLKTEFGSGTNTKKFINIQHEVAIGKASTLSIGARVEDGRQVNTMFQFKSKF